MGFGVGRFAAHLNDDCMTLIEFHEAAKKIVENAGWGGCQFSVTAGITLHAGSNAPFYEYRIAAHPESGLITSWDNDY